MECDRLFDRSRASFRDVPDPVPPGSPQSGEHATATFSSRGSLMPVCRGRDWPNAPRWNQGGVIGRPWPWVIHAELPVPPFDPNPFPDGIDLVPYGPPPPDYPTTWLYTQTDWIVVLEQLRDGTLPLIWRFQVSALKGSTGVITRWGSIFVEDVPVMHTYFDLPWREQVGSPGTWDSFGSTRIEPVPYDGLPADFCTGV